MRSNLARIMSRIGVNLAQSGTDVLITARQWPSDSVVDPVTQSRSGGTGEPVMRGLKTKGFVHFPQITANSQVRQFNEVEMGDCILDLHQDVDIDNRQDLTFMFLKPDSTPVDGQLWVPKPVSERLARSWGALVQGQRLFRPVLLRKATGGQVPANIGELLAWED